MSYLCSTCAVIRVVAACCLQSKAMALCWCIYEGCGFPLVDSGVCLRMREEVLEDQSFDHDV